DPQGGGGGVSLWIPARRRSGTHHGGRWAGGGPGAERRAHRGDREEEQRARGATRQHRRRTGAVVEVAEAGVWSGWEAGAELLHAGWRRPADEVAAHAARNPAHRRAARPARLQRLPRRRRQPAPDLAVRRARR